MPGAHWNWMILAGALAITPVPAGSFEARGVVVDTAGNPIENADVWLVQDHEVRRQQTDVSGAFLFPDVAPGPAEFVALKEGFSVGGASGYMLGPETLRILLTAPDELLLRLVDHLYQPVEGAAVSRLTIMDVFSVPVDDLEGHGFPIYRSGSDGMLTIPNLPKGCYVGFQVSHLRYADTRIPYLPTGDKRYPIQLYPGVSVRGRVTDAQGAGIIRARVVFWDAAAEQAPMRKEALTDLEGFYKVVLRPGEYYATANHPQYAPVKPQRLSVIESAEQRPVDFQLGRVHWIRGAVEGPGRKPWPGVRVAYLVEGLAVHEVLTTVDGTYLLKAPAGSGAVHVIPPDRFMLETPFDVQVTIIDVPETEVGPIRIKPLPEVTGVVRDAEGNPQSRVLISSLDLTPPLWTITDKEGNFRILIHRVPRGERAQFRAEHALRFQRAEFTADLRRGKPLDVRMKPFEPDLEPNDPVRARNDLTSLVDKPAPELDCEAWFNTDPLSLESLRGKVVVLTLWGGFAVLGPARDHIEEIRALCDLFEGVEDVVFVGVHDSGVEKELAGKYVSEYRVTFPVGYDSETAETFDRYCTNVIPQTVLIDKQGIVRYYDVEGRLLELIKSLRRRS